MWSLLCLPFTAIAQEPTTIPVQLVLTKEFCATKKRLSLAVLDVVKVGQPACQRLPEVLAQVFTKLDRLDQDPPSGTQANGLVAIPKFGVVSATHSMLSSRQELTITIEWTIRNAAGNLVWVQTVRGVASSAMPMLGKPRSKWIQTAMDDVVRASTAAMSSAPELASAVRR